MEFPLSVETSLMNFISANTLPLYALPPPPSLEEPPLHPVPLPVKPVPKKRSRQSCREDAVVLPTDHLTFLASSTHTLPQLKYICKQMKLRVTGNKSDLKENIRQHLLRIASAKTIQKAWRTFMHRHWSVARGPARFNRGLCINTTDFCTMENLTDQPFHRFFSYRDKDNKIYGFDLLSFYNLYHMPNATRPNATRNVTNPYNRKPIPATVYLCLYRVVRFSKILFNDYLNQDEDELDQESVDDFNEDVDDFNEDVDEGVVVTPLEFEREINVLFRAIDDLGNYSDPAWMLELERSRLLKFLRDLNDIWSHRANLRVQVKRDISPNGNPFVLANAEMGDLEYYEMDELRSIVIKVVRVFVYDGVNRDSRVLGAMYVLGALTLASHASATALPWLYASFL